MSSLRLGFSIAFVASLLIGLVVQVVGESRGADFRRHPSALIRGLRTPWCWYWASAALFLSVVAATILFPPDS